MILFREDWRKYPGAIPDYDTTNTTWVRLAGVMKSMGIENYNFHLALHNPDLKGVDPHSNTLSQLEISMIADEAAINPWYYLREVIRVPASGAAEPVKLRANRANVSLWWLFFNHVTTMLIQPRQTGKSVSTDALMSWLLTSGSLNTNISLLTKDDDLRVKNVKRLKELISSLPYYLDLRGKTDTNNTEKITINRLKNTYNTSVAQASVKAALNLGRGSTNAINHIDEIAFINNIDVTLKALLPASSAARDDSRAAGAPYGNIFTTTPGYLSSKSGRYAKTIYNDSLRWSELLFDSVNEEDLYENIRKNNRSGKLQVLLEYNHRQLGYTDEWLKGKIEDAMSDGEDAGSDFLNLWAEGNESSAIDKDILKLIKASIINEPLIKISKHGYIIRWYMSEDMLKTRFPSIKVVAGLDTSDAVSQDDLALVARDVSSGEVVFTGTYNETNLITFSEFIADTLLANPNITIIVERKLNGGMVIDNIANILMARGIDPFTRIFNWVVNDYKINKRYAEEVINTGYNGRDNNIYDKYRKQFGFATAGSGRAARDKLYGTVFSNSAKYTASTVRDKTLIDQIASLAIKNGRIDHTTGNHDDMVFAWLLGYWFLMFAENKEFYGINDSLVLATVNEQIVEEQGGAEMVRKRKKQQKIKVEIDNLITELKTTRDMVKANMLTGKINFLHKQIDPDVIKPFNIKEILENIMIEKRKNVGFYNYR